MEETLDTIEKEIVSPTYYQDLFLQVWRYEVFNADGQGITVGKITFAFIFLILGYFVARFLSRFFQKRLLSHLHIDSSLQYTWETFSFYAIYLLICLFVLQLLSIPLTIFAVVGGALAIGVGFGSQNIINNFISGLIIMVERPVRVGDTIEAEGNMGRVEQIGTRCTIIRTIENKQVVIPNSKLLDGTFINWTLTDRLVSNKVVVGVAYSSNVQKVVELLKMAAAEHEMILKSPEPTVSFVNFGESSLDFELNFWHRVDPSYGAGTIRSDIRFKILELFEAHKVSIPFPHREVIIQKYENSAGIKV